MTAALDLRRERPRRVSGAEIAVIETRWGERSALVTGHQGGPYLRMTPPVADAVVALVGVVAFSAILRRSHIELASPVSGGEAAFIVVALLVAAALHEFGHALAVKHAGRRVNGAGFQLYLGHPVFYVDSTDLLFGTRRQRALNAVVGLFIEAVLAGAVSLAVWRFPTASYA